MAFSPDRIHLDTADEDGTVLIRHLVLTPADACNIVALELTRADLITALGGETRRPTQTGPEHPAAGGAHGAIAPAVGLMVPRRHVAGPRA